MSKSGNYKSENYTCDPVGVEIQQRFSKIKLFLASKSKKEAEEQFDRLLTYIEQCEVDGRINADRFETISGAIENLKHRVINNENLCRDIIDKYFLNAEYLSIFARHSATSENNPLDMFNIEDHGTFAILEPIGDNIKTNNHKGVEAHRNDPGKKKFEKKTVRWADQVDNGDAHLALTGITDLSKLAPVSNLKSDTVNIPSQNLVGLEKNSKSKKEHKKSRLDTSWLINKVETYHKSEDLNETFCVKLAKLSQSIDNSKGDLVDGEYYANAVKALAWCVGVRSATNKSISEAVNSFKKEIKNHKSTHPSKELAISSLIETSPPPLKRHDR